MKRNRWVPVLVLSCLCMVAAVPPAAAAPPHAAFYYSCGTTFCGFDAEISYDPDGYITKYHWSWGDGTFTSGTNSAPTHTYAAHGTYNVILTVTDNSNETDATSLQVVF